MEIDVPDQLAGDPPVGQLLRQLILAVGQVSFEPITGELGHTRVHFQRGQVFARPPRMIIFLRQCICAKALRPR
jgi:hypothetical protein